MQISRRSVLAGAVLLAAGCHRHAAAAPPAAAPEPDLAAMNTARGIEQLLLSSYDARIAVATRTDRPGLEASRALHVAHLSALRGRAATATGGAATADVHRLLVTSAATLRSLSLNAVDGSNAALLASIAGSHSASAR